MVDIDDFLKKRALMRNLRKLNPISSRKGGRICFGKSEYIDLSSNDYLGLAGHPEMIEAAKKALDKFGTGSGASRLLTGDLDIHHQLEGEVARFKGKEASLVFNSGYQANTGILSSLYAKGDAIFSDRLNHASIVDGILLSGAKTFRFFHNDLNHLESFLRSERGKFKKALIVTETIFSMDGDRPDMKGLVGLKDRYDCQIMVDEAHATGIYGRNGSGVVEEEGVSEKIDLIMGTFSKALGSFGAYIATSKRMAEYLVNTCRSFIYSTSLPPPVIASNLAGLRLVKSQPYRREKLLESARRFRGLLRKRGFEIRGDSQIVPLVVGENKRAVEIAEALQKKGYWALPIRPPTVPQGQARIRFSLTFNHERVVLDKLIDDISDVRI